VPTLTLSSVPADRTGLFLKDVFDWTVAAVGLLLCLPVLVAIALVTKFSDFGPVLFRQVRSGRNGRLFTMYKFRTMVLNAEGLRASLAAQNEMDGPVFKLANDPRVTPFGRFLRRTSLDELPQLVNVISGEMSLVGPRPLPVYEASRIKGAQRRRLAMRPGMTGLWQVSGRNSVDFDGWMQLDLLYVDRWSFGLDLRILRRFRPETTWVLEPGDMLYLPPGVAHHGVALGDCLTYSIGFRAPSGREVVAAALRQGLTREDGGRLYRDPRLGPARHPGEIGALALRGLRKLAEEEWRSLAGEGFDTAVGALLTEPKAGLAPLRTQDPRRVRERLLRGASLSRVPGARLAFTRHRGRVLLFAEGHVLPLPPRLAFAGPLMTGSLRLSSRALRPHLRAPGFAALVAGLISAGALELGKKD
jgi:lipopolysaccharide/colanic/teichoic acid biosynthesis glycosyltransferase